MHKADKGTGYTFIPLKDDLAWDKGTLTAFAAPANFLIDQNGNVVWSGFFVNEFNQESLRLTISEVLDANTPIEEKKQLINK